MQPESDKCQPQISVDDAGKEQGLLLDTPQSPQSTAVSDIDNTGGDDNLLPLLGAQLDELKEMEQCNFDKAGPKDAAPNLWSVAHAARLASIANRDANDKISPRIQGLVKYLIQSKSNGKSIEELDTIPLNESFAEEAVNFITWIIKSPEFDELVMKGAQEILTNEQVSTLYPCIKTSYL